MLQIAKHLGYPIIAITVLCLSFGIWQLWQSSQQLEAEKKERAVEREAANARFDAATDRFTQSIDNVVARFTDTLNESNKTVQAVAAKLPKIQDAPITRPRPKRKKGKQRVSLCLKKVVEKIDIGGGNFLLQEKLIPTGICK